MNEALFYIGWLGEHYTLLLGGVVLAVYTYVRYYR